METVPSEGDFEQRLKDVRGVSRADIRGRSVVDRRTAGAMRPGPSGKLEQMRKGWAASALPEDHGALEQKRFPPFPVAGGADGDM